MNISYQNNRADGIRRQDVVLQGAAVALRLDVGGTLVMELKKLKWQQSKMTQTF